jgi:hypothetical protein
MFLQDLKSQKHTFYNYSKNYYCINSQIFWKEIILILIKAATKYFFETDIFVIYIYRQLV